MLKKRFVFKKSRKGCYFIGTGKGGRDVYLDIQNQPGIILCADNKQKKLEVLSQMVYSLEKDDKILIIWSDQSIQIDENCREKIFASKSQTESITNECGFSMFKELEKECKRRFESFGSIGVFKYDDYVKTEGTLKRIVLIMDEAGAKEFASDAVKEACPLLFSIGFALGVCVVCYISKSQSEIAKTLGYPAVLDIDEMF